MPAGAPPIEAAARFFGGEGVAGAVIDKLGVDPAQVQRILANVEGITADVKAVTGALAAIVSKFKKPLPPTAGVPAMDKALFAAKVGTHANMMILDSLMEHASTAIEDLPTILDSMQAVAAAEPTVGAVYIAGRPIADIMIGKWMADVPLPKLGADGAPAMPTAASATRAMTDEEIVAFWERNNARIAQFEPSGEGTPTAKIGDGRIAAGLRNLLVLAIEFAPQIIQLIGVIKPVVGLSQS